MGAFRPSLLKVILVWQRASPIDLCGHRYIDQSSTDEEYVFDSAIILDLVAEAREEGVIAKKFDKYTTDGRIDLNEELNEEFMSMLSDANISGLKGHRSVGGFRASMYNAMPLESVKTLVDVMQELTNKKG